MRPFGPMLSEARGSLATRGITVSQLLFQLIVTIAGVYVAIHLQDSADQRSRVRAASRTLAAVRMELEEDRRGLADDR